MKPHSAVGLAMRHFSLFKPGHTIFSMYIATLEVNNRNATTVVRLYPVSVQHGSSCLTPSSHCLETITFSFNVMVYTAV